MANKFVTCKYKKCKKRMPKESALRVPLGYFCDHACAISHGKAKAAENRSRVQKSKDKKWKQENKTYNQLVQEAEKEVRRYVRARDRLNPHECPSCRKSAVEVEGEQSWKLGGAWDAGHWRSKGSAPQHRFNTLNIWAQCKSCNAGDGKYRRMEAGVSASYRDWLVNRIGIARVEAIEGDNAIRKWSRDYLVRVKVLFARRANWYEKR